MLSVSALDALCPAGASAGFWLLLPQLYKPSTPLARTAATKTALEVLMAIALISSS
jgi:hypothetical protein